MRIALVQTSPKLCEVEKNIARATALLQNLKNSNRQVDLIVLPELAFTGYRFQSPRQLTPYVETKTASPTRDWARGIAKDFQAQVLVGLPTQDEQRHNTAILISPTGEMLHEYHKHHMFWTDYVWGCTPGPSFRFTTLNFDCRAIRSTIGICMDLNPWEFRAPPNHYEFANFVLVNDIQLVLLPMAWLKSADDELDVNEPGISTLTYWAARLEPLVKDAKTRTVVICNRTGEENGAVYAGTSCALQFGGGNVVLLGLLARAEGILTVDVAL